MSTMTAPQASPVSLSTPPEQKWALVDETTAYSLLRVRQVTTIGPGRWSPPLFPAGSVAPSDSTSSSGTGSTQVNIVLSVTIFSIVSLLVMALVIRKRRQNFKLQQLGLPPKDHWELVPLAITIGPQIGSGSFGKVYKGVLAHRYRKSEEVAIKVCYTGAAESEKKAFLSEAAMLKRICDRVHPNVVRLVGVCLQAQPFWIVQEFLPLGDLKTYLQVQQYSPEQLHGPYLSLLVKIRVIRDVVSAMEHLTALGFVHRDLAARNVLLAANLTAKLTDFGLTRSLSELRGFANHSPDSEVLPVRWLAPEVLHRQEYSSVSDVWSMGVLIWEVFQNGEMPYPSLNNEEVIEGVAQGVRLTQPEDCPDDVWHIAESCWGLVAERPSFRELHEYSNELLQQAALVDAMDSPLSPLLNASAPASPLPRVSTRTSGTLEPTHPAASTSETGYTIFNRSQTDAQDVMEQSETDTASDVVATHDPQPRPSLVNLHGPLPTLIVSSILEVAPTGSSPNQPRPAREPAATNAHSAYTRLALRSVPPAKSARPDVEAQ
jgi:serine/threonine protein kinase